MTANEITTLEQVKELPAGQWVLTEDGEAACLFDTHKGFPQRMWGMKADGGTKGYVFRYTALQNLPLPLRLADISSDYRCDHRRANECGQCEACGLPHVNDAAPVHFDGADMKLLRAVAEHNSRIEQATQ